MISEEKQRLRARMRERLKSENTASRSEPAGILAGWPLWQAARSVCAYCARADEPDVLHPWPDKLVALPRVDGENLIAHWVPDRESLSPGAFGIPEPRETSEIADGPFDLILVPGLAFDRSGARLGRGKGFYDRFLKDQTALKVGVCRDFQLIERVPTEEHDLRMDFVITSSAVIACGTPHTR